MTATFTIARTVNAPLTRVWRAWTQESELAQWFGPKGCPIFQSALDFRPGGTFHYGLRFPTGMEIWGLWTFEEMHDSASFSFLSGFSDPAGKDYTRNPWSATWPLKSHTVVTFKKVTETTTEVTLTATPHDAPPEEVATFTEGHASMTQGWGGTFEQFEAFLAQNPS